MPIQIEKRGTMVDAVEAKLIRAILEGVYGPGAPLPGEARLAQELGVSRPTLRHALRRLISRGLIEANPGRQTRISPIGQFAALDTLIAMLVDAPHSGDSRSLLSGLLEVRRHLYATLLTLVCERAKNLEPISEVCLSVAVETRRNAEALSFLGLELELLAVAARAANNRAFFYLFGSLHRLFERLPNAFAAARTPDRIAERIAGIGKMMEERNTDLLRRFTLEPLEAEDQASMAALTDCP